jgi:hypothetical protein
MKKRGGGEGGEYNIYSIFLKSSCCVFVLC